MAAGGLAAALVAQLLPRHTQEPSRAVAQPQSGTP